MRRKRVTPKKLVPIEDEESPHCPKREKWTRKDSEKYTAMLKNHVLNITPVIKTAINSKKRKYNKLEVKDGNQILCGNGEGKVSKEEDRSAEDPSSVL